MSALEDLEGKVAVVTGGASGIGRGLAATLVAEGMQVVIADIESEALEGTAAELGVVGIRTDVSDAASVEALAQAVVERFGAVHLVCNNAGIGGSAKVADLALTDWQWTLGVNLWGVIHGIHSFLPLLLANPDGGHIVNTASSSGIVSSYGLGAYTASKFAVVGLSECLAIELANDGAQVGVSILCPGLVRSNLGEYTRNRPAEFVGGSLGDPEVTKRAGFETRLASPTANWMDPLEAGAMVVDAVKRGDLYVITHPEGLPRAHRRHEGIEGAFRYASERNERAAVGS